MSNTKNCTILDININTSSLTEVLKTIDAFVSSRKPHQICTVNTEFVMAARKNPAFAKAINDSDLSLADGAGIILASQLLNQPRPPRITGADLTPMLATASAEKGYKMFLLGGEDGVGKQAADKLQLKNDKLQIVGTYEGGPADENVISIIKKANPDILLVAWGAPKSDLWIHQNKENLGIPVMMAVGGTFDFIAGKQKRAPKLMRDFGLEWLWRLAREPKRWRRQLALPYMFLLILASWLGIKTS